ncbi:signal peptide peptidase SppA [Terrihabitans sp. B22-R8]|uniref:signal peptide peptidase SppA n=1 Tax=Terrihabitans sp. B22-R8 TaxID=3425128 RepID=UPI00403D49D9
MAFDADGIVERRRLRRRVSFWRVAALVCAALALVFGGLKLSGFEPGKGTPHVARVQLSGVILGNDKRHKMLQEIARSRAAAVLLEIDSPGGGVTASEELYHDIRAIAAKKPVVAVLGSMAASGGYVAALAADHIVARQTSLTGSIGVLVQYPEASGLLGKLGVNVHEVKSAPLKAAPSMFTPTTPEGEAALQALVMDSFDWFKALVTERRGLEGENLARVVDGRAFTGRQALDLELVDEIGGEDEARTWLADNRDVSRSLPVREWKPETSGLSELGLARGLAAAAADGLGLPVLAQQIRAEDRGDLDGLVAIWHPSVVK